MKRAQLIRGIEGRERRYVAVKTFRRDGAESLAANSSLELFDCFSQRMTVLLIKENSRDIFYNGLKRAAPRMR